MDRANRHDRRAMLARVAIPAVAGGLFFWQGRPVAALVLWVIAAILLATGLFIPALYARLDRLGRAVGRLAATALTWVLLVPVFFLIFVPGRLLLKFRGLDPMSRKCPSPETTYWVGRKPVTQDSDYSRQF